MEENDGDPVTNRYNQLCVMKGRGGGARIGGERRERKKYEDHLNALMSSWGDLFQPDRRWSCMVEMPW